MSVTETDTAPGFGEAEAAALLDPAPQVEAGQGNEAEAAYRRGELAERERWATVLANRAFLRNPPLARQLLATTGISAETVVACLRDSPPAASAFPQRTAFVPQLVPTNDAPTATAPSPVSARPNAR